MMRSIFGGRLGIFGVDRIGRDCKARSRRLQPSVDGLERRELLTVAAGSVTLSAGVVTIVSAPTGPSTAVVSYQTVGGVKEVDVNLNGVDNYFGLGTVGLVSFQGSGSSGNETFQNETGLSTNAHGGSGTNLFIGGSGLDAFYGGSGTNTFDAGSGYDVLVGGTGSNTYNATTGSGLIIERGSTITVNAPPSYTVI